VRFPEVRDGVERESRSVQLLAELEVRGGQPKLQWPRTRARDNLVRMPRWDFDFGAITAPATIWSGLQDTGNVEGARWVAGHVQGAVLRELPDRGHFVAFELWDEVLDSLRV